MNRAYTKLMRAVFDGIDRNSKIAEKTPPEVVRFQNYHHCFAILSELRIEVYFQYLWTLWESGKKVVVGFMNFTEFD